jgi:hypothetical protein
MFEDDAVQGCQKYLAQFPKIVNMLGQGENGLPWLFNGDIYQNVASTSKAALVVRDAGSWGAPEPQTTAEFPRIAIEIWTDPPRDALGNVSTPVHARTKAYRIYRQVDRILNRTTSAVVVWGDLITFGCQRLGNPSYLQNTTDDHVLKLTVYYGVKCASFFTD